MNSVLKLVVLVLFFSSFTTAGDWASSKGSCFGKGSNMISFGPYLVFPGIGGWVSYEHGFHDAISGGGAISIGSQFYSDSWRYNTFSIMLRAAFHPLNLSVLADKNLSIRRKLDPFVGLSTGYAYSWWKYRYSGTSGIEPSALYPPFRIREYIGVRYYFTDNFFGELEDDGANGYITAGIGFRF